MNDPLVSIILRSYNEAWALCETLSALMAQEYKNWELIVIDSGSTDGSVDLIRRANPRHFIQIAPAEYVPGRVMNTGMRLAQSAFGIFINADATPQTSSWLRGLVEALQNPRHAAAFSKQIPRPDCDAVFACDYERCFGEDRESAKWDHFFSMVSSGLRKDVWAKRGFLENLQYAEDDEYTRWCKGQGYEVIYCPQSVVMHSHNYSPAQAYKRSFGDARAIAATRPLQPNETAWVRTRVLGWMRDLQKDLSYCLRSRRLRELPYAARIRWSQRKGRWDGLQNGALSYAKGMR